MRSAYATRICDSHCKPLCHGRNGRNGLTEKSLTSNLLLAFTYAHGRVRKPDSDSSDGGLTCGD